MAIAIDHYHFPSIDSTNTWAKANAAHFAKDRLTIITAGVQTAGRGRHKRKWVSPPDVNLYASYCLFLSSDRNDIANLPQIVALTTAELIHRYHLPAQLKWPNDILINGKKVAGILCDTISIGEQVCVIIGLGLNVNMDTEQLQQIADREATSLKVETRQLYDLAHVTEELEASIQQAIDTYLLEGFTPFLDNFRHAIQHRTGDAISFHFNNQLVQTTFHRINNDGTLSIIVNDHPQSFHSGEIT